MSAIDSALAFVALRIMVIVRRALCIAILPPRMLFALLPGLLKPY